MDSRYLFANRNKFFLAEVVRGTYLPIETDSCSLKRLEVLICQSKQILAHWKDWKYLSPIEADSCSLRRFEVLVFYPSIGLLSSSSFFSRGRFLLPEAIRGTFFANRGRFSLTEVLVEKPNQLGRLSVNKNLPRLANKYIESSQSARICFDWQPSTSNPLSQQESASIGKQILRALSVSKKNLPGLAQNKFSFGFVSSWVWQRTGEGGGEGMGRLKQPLPKWKINIWFLTFCICGRGVVRPLSHETKNIIRSRWPVNPKWATQLEFKMSYTVLIQNELEEERKRGKEWRTGPSFRGASCAW